MGSWAHREATALLDSKVEAGHLTGETESRIRQYLADGKTTLALEALVYGVGTEQVASD